ncbi:hypothetical protein [Hymenobacter sp.]|uniref:hypothetical protein n=1 Tax=Hymenobacter sp. TaxID=1898978 RepID=UPI00286A6516|nr:hypothetical protein [Hymenobacter sp.]
MEHLQAFIESFIAKRYKDNWLHKIARAKPNHDIVRGMDALHRELDERYCEQLPKGSQQQEISFVLKAIAEYKLTTCYVLSAHEPFNQKTMPIAEALSEIVGSSSTTIISFLPGKVAYFEGHSIGDRYMCINKKPSY